MGAIEPVARAGWQARLALRFERRDLATRLVLRSHEGPLCVQRPLYPQSEAVCHAIVLHPPGGIAGGDELEMRVAVGAGAHALVTTPGASKWYRSNGPRAQQRATLTVEDDGVLEWLPQESIVFDHANADMRTTITLGERATLIAWDILCFGRAARGEQFDHGRVGMGVDIQRGDRRLWLERGLFEGGARVMTSPVGLAGCGVTGTLIAASSRLTPALLNACREIAPTQGSHGVTLLPELLVARYLGDSAEAARAYFAQIWAALRPSLNGMAPMQPRIWNT